MNISQEQFISDCRKTHGDRYDLSNVVYVGVDYKIIVKCNKCGNVFTPTANNFKRNKSKCRCHSKPNKTILRDKFIKSCNELYDNKYNYDQAVYLNNKIPLEVICPIHGSFWKTPLSHLNRNTGCPECVSGTTKWDTAKFIREATSIHGNKYDYSKAIYNNGITPIIIICPVHGEFMQKPVNHIHDKNGCPTCRESKGEKKIRVFLEMHNIDYQSQKTYNDCIYKAHLYYDFFIPDKNTLIEFDGRQHFEPDAFINKDSKLEVIKMRDSIKTAYAISHGIKLLRIPYTELSKISDILTEHLLNT